MSVNVHLAIPHICLVVKEKKRSKTAKNNDQNDHISALFGILFGKFEKKMYLQNLYNCQMYMKKV